MSMYKNAAEPDATATLFGAADGHVLYEPAVLVGDATMWTYHVQLEANLKQQCGTTAEQIATLEYHLRLQASSPPTRAWQLLTYMLWHFTLISKLHESFPSTCRLNRRLGWVGI